jgi:hypothetical protein
MVFPTFLRKPLQVGSPVGHIYEPQIPRRADAGTVGRLDAIAATLEKTAEKSSEVEG